MEVLRLLFRPGGRKCCADLAALRAKVAVLKLCGEQYNPSLSGRKKTAYLDR